MTAYHFCGNLDLYTALHGFIAHEAFETFPVVIFTWGASFWLREKILKGFFERNFFSAIKGSLLKGIF